MSELDFQKIFASGASSQIDWTDDNYLKGWGYLGNVPPSYQSFDSLQRLNDLKFKYLYDEFMGIETNTEELISNHNENSEAHKTLFDKKLDKNGGTVTGNLNASGYNITATKFIGNLQGNADSATKANQDKNGKDITGYLYKTEDLTLNSNAEILTVGNISEILNSFCTKFKQIQGTGTYAENSPTSIKSLNDNKAPKASPAFSGTPTAPTPGVDTNNTQLATCGFVRNAIAKYAPMLDTMKKIYPVGSIYMSTVSTNPATLFGFGTWEAMPAGHVLLAQGKSSWGTTYNAGSTGGEATHQLTVGELPTHNHNASTNNVNQNGNIGWLQAGKDYNFSGVFATSSKNQGANVGNGESTGVWNCIFDSTHSHNVTINNTGSNQSHNNLQPYISVYIWKRTA